jgi:hypothetical protein
VSDKSTRNFPNRPHYISALRRQTGLKTQKHGKSASIGRTTSMSGLHEETVSPGVFLRLWLTHT